MTSIRSLLVQALCLGLALALPTSSNLRRRAADTKIVVTRPFKVTLRSNATSDPNPGVVTAAEENAMVLAFANWFHTHSVAYYLNSRSFEYSKTVCKNKYTTSYDATARTHNPDAVYDDKEARYSFDMECEALFTQAMSATDAANPTTVGRATRVPPTSVVVTTASDNYPFPTFIPDFLRPAMPADSKFQTATLVMYNMVFMYTPTTTSTVPTTDQTVPAPTMAPTTAAPAPTTPVPVPAMAAPPGNGPAPTAFSISGEAYTGTPSKTVEMILEWNLGVPQYGYEDNLRQPTPDEYDKFLSTVKTWLKDTLSYAYNEEEEEEEEEDDDDDYDDDEQEEEEEEASKDLPEFYSLDSTLRSTSFDATAEAPHTIVIVSDVVFRNTPEAIPMGQWVRVVREMGLSEFRHDYLEPAGGIFAYVTSIQWKALME